MKGLACTSLPMPDDSAVAECTYVWPTCQATSNKAGSKESGLLGMPLSVAMHPGVWAVFIAHIAFNNGAYYLTNWSPTYYADVLKMSPADAKYHLMAPHVANLAAKSAVPPLVALVGRMGYSLLASRKIFTVVGFVLAGMSLAPVYRLHTLSPMCASPPNAWARRQRASGHQRGVLGICAYTPPAHLAAFRPSCSLLPIPSSAWLPPDSSPTISTSLSSTWESSQATATLLALLLRGRAHRWWLCCSLSKRPAFAAWCCHL